MKSEKNPGRGTLESVKIFVSRRFRLQIKILMRKEKSGVESESSFRFFPLAQKCFFVFLPSFMLPELPELP